MWRYFRSSLILSKCFKINKLLIKSLSNMSLDQYLEQPKCDLKKIFLAGIKAVLPNEIIRKKVTIKNETLFIDNNPFSIGDKIYLVGFGKAVMGMAIELEKVLGDRLVRGIISVPEVSMNWIWQFNGNTSFPNQKDKKIEFYEGATNNYPDSRSLETTHKIIDLIESLTQTDTLIVLISGGGSALLYMPRPVIDSEDKLHLCKKLQNAGADITELNIVRRKLSMVKGGGLARMAYPAKIISLIISDIIGDPIDLIASGPTVHNEKVPEEVVSVLKKYNLHKSLEGDLKTIILSKEILHHVPLNSAKEFEHVNNIILANNLTAIEGMKVESLRKNHVPIILQNNIKGNVHDVSLAYVHVTNLICLVLDKILSKEEFSDNICNSPIISISKDKADEIYNIVKNLSDNESIVLIGAGEPTVIVTGEGKGGRNQELALYFSLDWLAKVKSNPQLAKYNVIILSGGTDGQDGPTDAAGAFGYPAIGPIVYELHAMLKSMTGESIMRIQPKKVTDEVSSDTKCKINYLSNFVTLKSIKLQEQETAETQEFGPNISSTSLSEDIDPLELTLMEVERMLPENVFIDNDSNNFYTRYRKGKDLIKTGFTGTNVMDLHCIYIKKHTCKCDINFVKKYEDILDEHDLHIDPLTIEKYKALHRRERFEKDMSMIAPSLLGKEMDHLNITIEDENFREPCCNKHRKFSDIN